MSMIDGLYFYFYFLCFPLSLFIRSERRKDDDGQEKDPGRTTSGKKNNQKKKNRTDMWIMVRRLGYMDRW